MSHLLPRRLFIRPVPCFADANLSTPRSIIPSNLSHPASLTSTTSTPNIPGSLTSSSTSTTNNPTNPTLTSTGGGGGSSIYPSRLSGKARPGTGSNSDPNNPGSGGGSENVIKWGELLERFRQIQEKARRRNRALLRGGGDGEDEDEGMLGASTSQSSRTDVGAGVEERGRSLGNTIGNANKGRGEKALPDIPVLSGLKSAPLTGSGRSGMAHHQGGGFGSGTGATGGGGGVGRPLSASSGRFTGAGAGSGGGYGSRLLTPGVGTPTVSGPGAGTTGGGGGAGGPGHRKSKSSISGFGRLNLGGAGGRRGGAAEKK